MIKKIQREVRKEKSYMSYKNMQNLSETIRSQHVLGGKIMKISRRVKSCEGLSRENVIHL